MTRPSLQCPSCHSINVGKNGKIHTGKQNHKCGDCGRQFVLNPTQKRISAETKGLIDKLLLEKLPMAGIARVADVSEPWLQEYVNGQYRAMAPQAKITAKKRRLTLECDKAWSCVGNKGNRLWIWLAIDRNTREIVGTHVGDRSRTRAKTLWCSLSPVYRQCAVCYTDFWNAYDMVIPSKRHRPVGKDCGQTNQIEQFNCILRQRVSRLVRKTMLFSKKVENHIVAIWYFIHHYNESLLL